MKGHVILVGGGPGDPGLLTLAGRAALLKADIVLYDDLVNPAILSWASHRAKKIFVGVRAGNHNYKKRFNRIFSLYKQEVRKGNLIVRLKGGDPFLFGRGGEECLFLKEQHIPFSIIPGVTSATAVPAAAGIPLTMRDMSSVVTIVTGHGIKTGTPSQMASKDPVGWESIPKNSTLVILMGLKNLDAIARRLIHEGWDPETKAAVISNGTLSHQKKVEGVLASLAKKVRKARLKPPATIIIGSVVGIGAFMRK